MPVIGFQLDMREGWLVAKISRVLFIHVGKVTN